MNRRLVLLIMGEASIAVTAHAAVLYVDKGAPGAGTGASRMDAFTTIQPVLIRALVG